MFDFEEQREANIARNKQLLADLGIVDTKEEINKVVQDKRKAKTKAKQQKKRKQVDPGADSDEAKPEKKPRTTAPEGENVEGDAPLGGVRRSGRNAGKKVDYRGDGDNLNKNDEPRIISEAARKYELAEAKTPLDRKHDPRVFGSIPGIKVGTWWATREECSKDAIHAPWVGGIAGSPQGCYSVALSGGYEDDIDLGEAFTYTGAGGRDLKGTKEKPKNLRTAPQSCDQDFENRNNKAILKSVETKKPVRVIRGYKLHSKYAPLEGYRYDGLYTVEKAWQEKGLNPKGYLVCKFVFKRIPGQPPLPIYEDRGAVEEDAEDSDATPETEGDENEKEESDNSQTLVASDT